MLLVNLSSGRTERFDLEQEGDAERWSALQSDRSFQRSIAGVQVRAVVDFEVVDGDSTRRVRDKYTFSVPMPKGAPDVTVEAFLVRDGQAGEVRREVAKVYAFGVCVSLTVYRRRAPPEMVRVDLTRPGRRVLLPPPG